MKLSNKFTSPTRTTRRANECTPSPSRKVRRMNKNFLRTLNSGFFSQSPTPEPPKVTEIACGSDEEYKAYMRIFKDNVGLIDVIILHDDGTVTIYNREAKCILMDKIPDYIGDGLYSEDSVSEDSDNQEEQVSSITIRVTYMSYAFYDPNSHRCQR